MRHRKRKIAELEGMGYRHHPNTSQGRNRCKEWKGSNELEEAFSSHTKGTNVSQKEMTDENIQKKIIMIKWTKGAKYHKRENCTGNECS